MAHDHLACRLRSYMEKSGVTAISIEARAGLPNATVSRICDGRNPRPDNLAKLLRAVPGPIASDLLVGHMMDSCPHEWQRQVQIIIRSTGAQTADRVSDSSPHLNTVQSRLERAFTQLQKAASGDAKLAEFIIKTAELMRLL